MYIDTFVCFRVSTYVCSEREREIHMHIYRCVIFWHVCMGGGEREKYTHTHIYIEMCNFFLLFGEKIPVK